MAGRHIHILTTIICYFLLDASISKKFLNVALEQSKSFILNGLDGKARRIITSLA